MQAVWAHCSRCGQRARTEPDLGIVVCKHCDEVQELSVRAAAVAPYLATVADLGRMVERLGELHASLSADDRLQQVLHSLSFVWGYVEAELRAAARPGNH